MCKSLLILMFLVLLCSQIHSVATYAEHEKCSEPYDFNSKNTIKHLLAEMVKKDQDIRSKIDFSSIDDALMQELKQVDQDNLACLKVILQHHEWITISEFGSEADHDAWLLVQHADSDVAFQKYVLAILEKLYQTGETSSKNFAYLYDRVAMHENRPQRYGTQGKIVDNRFIFNGIEDRDTLDVRRKAMGLCPFEEYQDKIRLLIIKT